MFVFCHSILVVFYLRHTNYEINSYSSYKGSSCLFVFINVDKPLVDTCFSSFSLMCTDMNALLSNGKTVFCLFKHRLNKCCVGTSAMRPTVFISFKGFFKGLCSHCDSFCESSVAKYICCIVFGLLSSCMEKSIHREKKIPNLACYIFFLFGNAIFVQRSLDAWENTTLLMWFKEKYSI